MICLSNAYQILFRLQTHGKHSAYSNLGVQSLPQEVSALWYAVLFYFFGSNGSRRFNSLQKKSTTEYPPGRQTFFGSGWLFQTEHLKWMNCSRQMLAPGLSSNCFKNKKYKPSPPPEEQTQWPEELQRGFIKSESLKGMVELNLTCGLDARLQQRHSFHTNDDPVYSWSRIDEHNLFLSCLKLTVSYCFSHILGLMNIHNIHTWKYKI